MDKYLMKKFKARQKQLKRTFKQHGLNLIKIEDLNQAKMLLFEYIRDGYTALLLESEASKLDKVRNEHEFFNMKNVVEVAFEQTALAYRNEDEFYRKSGGYAIIRMSNILCLHIAFLEHYNKQNLFKFAEKLGSVYSFLLKKGECIICE